MHWSTHKGREGHRINRERSTTFRAELAAAKFCRTIYRQQSCRSRSPAFCRSLLNCSNQTDPGLHPFQRKDSSTSRAGSLASHQRLVRPEDYMTVCLETVAMSSLGHPLQDRTLSSFPTLLLKHVSFSSVSLHHDRRCTPFPPPLSWLSSMWASAHVSRHTTACPLSPLCTTSNSLHTLASEATGQAAIRFNWPGLEWVWWESVCVWLCVIITEYLNIIWLE